MLKARMPWAFWALVAAVPVDHCLAQQLLIGTGATLQLASGRLDLGCHSLQVQGNLELQSGQLTGVNDVVASGSLRGGMGDLRLSGDFDAASAFIAENGSVMVSDGCARTQSAIVGEHVFNRLFLHSNVGRVQLLPADQVQSVTAAAELLGETERLVLRSSTPGTVAFLSLAGGGLQQVQRVDVQDVGAPPEGQYLAPALPAEYDSIDRGNTPRFFSRIDQLPVHPVPLLGPWGLTLLVLLIAVLSVRRLPISDRGQS